MASATIANPKELAERLSGEAVTELTESGAPSGEKIFICYNPPVVNPELGIRAPYLGEAAKLTAAFSSRRSRRSCSARAGWRRKWCWRA
jgi:DEAD/DEAH box helicase domain-containing protein